MLALQPIGRERFPTWRDASAAALREGLIGAGIDPGEVDRVVAEQVAALFPGGGIAQGHAVFDVYDEHVRVGTLWVGPSPFDNSFFVWDIVIEQALQGRGYGRATMQLAESAGRDGGYASIGLEVTDANTRARRLYESLGYETVATAHGRRVMSKRLAPA